MRDRYTPENRMCYKTVPSFREGGPKSKVCTESPMLQPEKVALHSFIFCLAPLLSPACQLDSVTTAIGYAPCKVSRAILDAVKVTLKNKRDNERCSFAR